MKKASKIIIGLLLCILVLAPALAACTSETPTTVTATTTATATSTATATTTATATKTATATATTTATVTTFEWPRRLYIGTSGVGSTHHVIGSAWGAKLEEKEGVSVRVIPEADSTRIQGVIDGNIDINFFNLGEMKDYYEGQGAYADLAKVAQFTLWMEYDPPMGYAVAGDSPLVTFQDVRDYVATGKKIRVATFAPAVSWSKRATKGFCAFANIDESDIEVVPIGSIRDMYYSVIDGKADVFSGGFGTSILPELMATPKKVRFFDQDVNDTEAWKRFLEVMKCDWPAVPVGDWVTVKDFVGYGSSISASVWTVTPDMGEELVYNLAKWLNENYDDYSRAGVEVERMGLDIFRDYLNISPFPVHPGAVKYLKEIGKWTAEDDVWNAESTALMQRYIDAWAKAEAEAASKGVTIEVGNAEWNAIYADAIKGIPEFKSRF